MELNEAIKKLEKFDCTYCPFVACEQCEINNGEVIAINTVLKELENRYKKGQREGWKCGFNYAIQQKEYKNDRTIKIKNEYLRVMYLLLLDYDGYNSSERLKELIDETTEYIKKAIKNDDKSVITVNSKKKFNILGEEVE